MMDLSLTSPLVVALITLVSVSALKWSARTIVAAIANRGRVKVRFCPRCQTAVHFNPPIRLPGKSDLINASAVAASTIAAYYCDSAFTVAAYSADTPPSSTSGPSSMTTSDHGSQPAGAVPHERL
jgi:hypothetical protein